jgi:hypothetical protein
LDVRAFETDIDAPGAKRLMGRLGPMGWLSFRMWVQLDGLGLTGWDLELRVEGLGFAVEG